MLVDEVGCLPEDVGVDVAVEAEPCERLRQHLARGAVQRQRDRVDRASDQLGSGPGRLDRGGERVSARSLAVDGDGKPAFGLQPLHQLVRAVRRQRAGRVVQDDAGGAESGQLARLLDEKLCVAGTPGAVDQAALQLLAGCEHGVGRRAQVVDVVHRIVEAEDVDAVGRRAGDEAADDVVLDRMRADQEATAKCKCQRRLGAHLDRADALPGTLHAAPDRRLEAAATGDVQIGEAGAVEQLGKLVQVARGDAPGQRLLTEQANRGVYKCRHLATESLVDRPRGLLTI